MRSIFLISLTILFSSITAWSAESATEHPKTSEEVIADVREKLSPAVEKALREHCGEDCPGYRIDVQMKKVAQSSMDDLGFSRVPEKSAQPNISSVTLSILINGQVSKTSRESLKQIVSHLISNDSPAPLNVQIKTLDGVSPALDKKSQPIAAAEEWTIWADKMIWPLSLFVGLLLVLFGLILFLRNRRELLRDRLNALRARSQAKTQENSQPDTKNETKLSSLKGSIPASRYLDTHSQDIQWLLEDLTQNGDTKSLSKVLSAYSPQDLSSRLELSPPVLKALSSLPLEREKSNPEESHQWLNEVLDQVHWKRIREQRLPLARIARLNAAQQTQLFSQLNTVNEKALMLASLPEDRWPSFLSLVPSAERIQVGLELNRFRGADAESRQQTERQLLNRMIELDRANSLVSDEMLENFTLYLTEKESHALWDEMSKMKDGRPQRNAPPSLSIESLIQNMDLSMAAEVFSNLDMNSLATLVNSSASETQAKILAALPKSLRERLTPQLNPTSKADEAQLMKARARLLDAYRRFSQRIAQ